MDRKKSIPADKANPATHSDAARWLAAIVESSDDAIIGKNLDGIITSWNSGAQRIFGYSSDEAVGKPIAILIPQSLWAEETEILERLRSGGRIDHLKPPEFEKMAAQLRSR
ncbi:MAG: PAS domain S-box protein [Terracidiphilus sp.]